ncbi:MAG: hypothetical protein J0L92_33915 [Deltaproteobacteria bacterium]|nr:hypothetical protein [Deltaproteobacteria bacterium]
MTENQTVRRRRVVVPGEDEQPSSELARELAQQSDALSAAYDKAAAAIAGLRLGVSGAVAIAQQQDPDDTDATIWSLRFAKDGDEWALTITKWNTDEPEWNEHAMEPAHAPRWIRERGAKVLPELVKKLHHNAREELARVRAATAEIESFAANIESLSKAIGGS